MSEKIQNQCDLLPLGASMAIVTKYYYGALSKMLESIDLERHYTTLILIHKTKNKCTQQYLSDMLHVDKVYMVHILDYLNEKGLVKRIKNPEDRREHLISLTAKGGKVIPEIEKSINQLNQIGLKGISKEEQKVFWMSVQTIMNNLKHLPTNEVDIKIKK
ncbi:MAG: MarR family transcriptional regulator [Bacteroidia bacterium]|nr:MarR family transcriptional regulator [Bacteroidia bacterium]